MPIEDESCVRNCTSSEHGELISAALTKRAVTDAELCAYLNSICQCCGSSIDGGGRTALHIAASCGRTAICKWLICQKQATIDEKDTESGYTALHRSIFYGKIDTAVALMKLGSNPNLLDTNCLSPLGHAMMDNLLCNLTNASDRNKLIYMWGSNSNYTLGPVRGKTVPELMEHFHKTFPNSEAAQVCLEKFHTIIVDYNGAVYTYGHGQGGRLGLGSENTMLEPTEVKFSAQPIVVKSACAARDHSMFLTDCDHIWVCGLNTHCVLGINPPPAQLLTPRSIHYNFHDLKGICCGRYHSVAWNNDAVYTWGLNAGQLGHDKIPAAHILTPKSVTSVKSNDKSIISVAASDGATVVATAKGDVYVLHEFQCRKIASRELGIVSVQVIGGRLVADNLDGNGTELKVVALTKSGKILIWQESDPQLSRCVFSLNRLIKVKQAVLNLNGLLLLTHDGEIFTAKLKQRNKREAMQEKTSKLKGNTFNKFLDKHDCIMTTIERVPKIYNADSCTCDLAGENFIALQVNPSTYLTKIPELPAPSIVEDFSNLLHENCDIATDITFKIGSFEFPAHKFIIANRSDKLLKLLESDRVEIPNIHHTVFAKVLEYIYTNTCELLQEGDCPESFVKLCTQTNQQNKTSSISDKNVINNKELALIEDNRYKSAFEVYKNQVSNKKSEKVATSDKLDPLRSLQEAAKKLGVNGLYKDINHFVYNNGKIKMKSGHFYKPKLLSWNHETFTEFYDVDVVSKNGRVIRAHKCVLVARSEFFMNMFSMRWSNVESQSKISLPFTQNCLHHLLAYLYQDQVNLETEEFDTICDLLVLADHILLTRLTEICEFALLKFMTLKNVFKMISLAHLYNAKQLKTVCMEYISLNLPLVLECRYLEQLEDEILNDLTVFYASWHSKMSQRVITPYSDAASDDIIQVISKSHPISMDFDGEVIVHTPVTKTARRKRNRSHKVSISERAEDKKDVVITSTKQSQNFIIESPTKTIPSRILAIINARERLEAEIDDGIEGEFCSLKLNDFPELNTSFGSPEGFLKSPIGKTERVERHKVHKMSQKERKRLSSETKEVVMECPRNPWKIIEATTSPVGSPDVRVTMSTIITEERLQKENLSKIRSKLLVHTQMEDKALEDLEKFYNVENVFDEIISVHRVQIGLVAAPVWVQK